MNLPASKILENKTEEDILEPKPRTLVACGKSYQIYPMPDSVLMHVSSNLDGVVSVVDALITSRMANPGKAMEPRDIMPIIPQIVKFLIPNATAVIAGCLRIEEKVVANNFRLAEKLEAIRLIVEAEDLPLIIKNFEALTEAFQPAAPAEPEAATPAAG